MPFPKCPTTSHDLSGDMTVWITKSTLHEDLRHPTSDGKYLRVEHHALTKWVGEKCWITAMSPFNSIYFHIILTSDTSYRKDNGLGTIFIAIFKKLQCETLNNLLQGDIPDPWSLYWVNWKQNHLQNIDQSPNVDNQR